MILDLFIYLCVVTAVSVIAAILLRDLPKLFRVLLIISIVFALAAIGSGIFQFGVLGPLRVDATAKYDIAGYVETMQPADDEIDISGTVLFLYWNEKKEQVRYTMDHNLFIDDCNLPQNGDPLDWIVLVTKIEGTYTDWVKVDEYTVDTYDVTVKERQAKHIKYFNLKAINIKTYHHICFFNNGK